MTVYKAKGLEFPVVILADPTYKATRDVPSRYVDPSRRLWLEQLCGSALFKGDERPDFVVFVWFIARDAPDECRIFVVPAKAMVGLKVKPSKDEIQVKKSSSSRT
jgi:superfamily I DNA/RNA helicase